MKVRSGFVSNSSSSSYIVAVPEEESFDKIEMNFILKFIEEGPEQTHIFYNVLTGKSREIINKILGGGNESLCKT